MSLEADIRTCRVCGCTDEQACEDGCTWVADPAGAGDLCSTCEDVAALTWENLEEAIVRSTGWPVSDVGRALDLARARGFTVMQVRDILLPAVRTANEFEAAMRDVQRVVALTPDEVIRMAEQIRAKLSRKAMRRGWPPGPTPGPRLTASFVGTITRDGVTVVQVRCPECLTWQDVDKDQADGKVSMRCSTEGCSFHRAQRIRELIPREGGA